MMEPYFAARNFHIPEWGHSGRLPLLNYKRDVIFWSSQTPKIFLVSLTLYT